MSPRTWTRLGTGLTLLAAAALYLAGNGRVSLWDRDEPRYAQCSRQMLQSGDWIVPRYLNQLRIEKPPLIYYCQAAAMKALGDTDFAARLPSSIAMVLLLAVIAIVVDRALGPAHAFWTAFILSSSALVIASAKMCMTDAVLLLWITGGQICLFAIHRRTAKARDGEARRHEGTEARREGEGGEEVSAAVPPLSPDASSTPSCLRASVPRCLPALMWLCIALGGMTKGPIALVPPIMTALVLWIFDAIAQGGGPRAWGRSAKWMAATRPLLGLGILIVIGAPWVIAISIKEPKFLPTILALAGKHMGTSMEGHKGPPGYYLATIWAMFYPWSLLLPVAVVLGVVHRRELPVRFALAAVVGPWIFQEIMKTKLPHYFLPAYPALAFLTADALVRCVRREHDNLQRPGFIAVVGGWVVITIAVTSAPWAFLALDKSLPCTAWWGMVGLSAVGFAFAIGAAALFCWRRLAAASIVMGAGMMLWIAILSLFVLPHVQSLRLGYRTAEIMRREGATKLAEGDGIMIDFKEPSLAFYQGGTIREEKRDHLLTTEPPEKWPTWIVLTDRIWNETPPEMRALLEVRGSVHGVAYADEMRVMDVMVVKKKLLAASGPTTAP